MTRDQQILADIVYAHVTTEEPTNPRLGWHLSDVILPKVPRHLMPSCYKETERARWFNSALSDLKDPRFKTEYGRARLPNNVPWPLELSDRPLEFLIAAFRLTQMGIEEITPENLAPLVGLQPSTTYVESNLLVHSGIFRRVRTRVYASRIDPDEEFWIPAHYHDLTEGRFSTLRQEAKPPEEKDAMTFSMHHEVLRSQVRETIKIVKRSIAEQQAMLVRLEAEEAALDALTSET